MNREGSLAALGSQAQRAAMEQGVIAKWDALAREQLRVEAVAKITLDHINLHEVFDHIGAGTRLATQVEQAIAEDDSFEVLRLIKTAREEVLEARRRAYVEKHVEERIWALENSGED